MHTFRAEEDLLLLWVFVHVLPLSIQLQARATDTWLVPATASMTLEIWKLKISFKTSRASWKSKNWPVCVENFRSVPSLWWCLQSPAAPLQTCCPSPHHPHKCFCLYRGHRRGSGACVAAPSTWPRCLWFFDCSGWNKIRRSSNTLQNKF